MDADEARRTDAKLRRMGIPWVVAPVDPEAPAGRWGVYDSAEPSTRKPIAPDVLGDVMAKLLATRPELPGKQQAPTRGFILLPQQD
ncbi:hypothetical protein [Streptomyces sp. CBMA152]|uniref:hypothetical protein n=1 Tax=Streptomyces sp. CBMA152 TaxID=1896312 RepID=UPI0016614E47|nr:hypothetical protein [Streptomyces sp. CBMA152]MBD0747076.1 hypothetical protein [Streptomyces sp. CBMA152]